jgi:ribosomal protein L10
LIEQKKLTVNNVVAFKKEIANENVVAKVVKKRMFSQTAIKNGFDDNTLPTLSGSVLMMVTDKEDFAGLKVIQKMNKAFKKLENKPELSFLG